MIIITIRKTEGKGGFVANVNGFQGATTIAKDEITALKYLVERLETKNPSFIQRTDWEWGNDEEISR